MHFLNYNNLTLEFFDEAKVEGFLLFTNLIFFI